MINTNRYKPTILAVLTILAFSTFIPALAYAQPLANTAKDWQYVNANSWGWNYSPQTQITKDNVDNLEVKWIFPIESKALAPEGMQPLGLFEGTSAPPVVYNGVIYVTSNVMRTYALDAKTGKQIWTHDYEIDIEDVQNRLPLLIGPAHVHGFRYWESGDVILLSGLACDFYAIDAKTGETSFWVKDLCKDVPGNIYLYRLDIIGTSNQANIGTYEKGRQFTYVIPGRMHSTIFYGDGRHVTLGIDMNTHQILWRVYSFPPQDRPVKDWALQECDTGFFQDIPCSDVAAAAPENLEWDWAFPGENPSPYGGVTANWGETIIDEDTGMMYTQTGNQGPYTNISLTPGPRLYGSTIMAIDMDTGQRIWWLQPFPRDPYDYDCNWGGILIDHSTLGKVYMKGCKEGRLYVMDAATGKPHYVVDVVDEQVKWGQISAANAKAMPEGVKYHLTDPLSYYDLREWRSAADGTYCTAPCVLYPHWGNGLFGTDMSYDPETQTLFHYATGQQVTIISEHPYIEGERVTLTQTYPIKNTSIVARDVATGNVKWTWFWPLEQQRAHMVVTPDLVFTGFKDGYMRFFVKDTGDLLREMNLGSDIRVGVATGQDSDGNQMIFVIAGISSTFGSQAPGVVVALGLSERAAAEVRTTTVTTTTTTTTRITTTTTSTTTQRTTTTVTSSITRTVTSTTATTITTTLAPQTITTTTTAPAQTITTTQEITETVGLPSTVTYAAVAIAVIAIIAAAVLATRRRT